jgi:hypothetical protein
MLFDPLRIREKRIPALNLLIFGIEKEMTHAVN